MYVLSLNPLSGVAWALLDLGGWRVESAAESGTLYVQGVCRGLKIFVLLQPVSCRVLINLNRIYYLGIKQKIETLYPKTLELWV